MKRGDVRTALLVALLDGAAHGYELSSRLEKKSGGTWRPSPGSVYPTLQSLEDEALVVAEERDGKKIYELTKSGKAEATERAKQDGGAPWDAVVDEESETLRDAVHEVRMAAKQISIAGNEDQRRRARAILADARKQIYELLAKG